MIFRTYLLLYIWSKLLSSSRDALLKLSEATNPQKMFASDCNTLYIKKGLTRKSSIKGRETLIFFRYMVEVSIVNPTLSRMHPNYENTAGGPTILFNLKFLKHQTRYLVPIYKTWYSSTWKLPFTWKPPNYENPTGGPTILLNLKFLKHQTRYLVPTYKTWYSSSWKLPFTKIHPN